MDDLIAKFEDWAAERGGVWVVTVRRVKEGLKVSREEAVRLLDRLVETGLAMEGYAVEYDDVLLKGFYECDDVIPASLVDRLGRSIRLRDAVVVDAFSISEEINERVQARRKDPGWVVRRLRKSGRLGDWVTVEEVCKATALPQEVVEKYLDGLVSDGKAVKKVRVSESEVTEFYVVDGVDYSCPLGMGRLYVPSQRVSWSREVEYGYRFLDSEGKADG